MKYLVAIVFGLLSSICYSQDVPCKGEYKKKLAAGDTAVFECRMVVMNPETFSGFYHDRKSLLILREEVPDYLIVIDSLNTLHAENRVDLDSINLLHTEVSELYVETKDELMLDVTTLTDDVNREKKRGKFWRKLSTVLIVVDVVIVVVIILVKTLTPP